MKIIKGRQKDFLRTVNSIFIFIFFFPFENEILRFFFFEISVFVFLCPDLSREEAAEFYLFHENSISCCSSGWDLGFASLLHLSSRLCIQPIIDLMLVPEVKEVSSEDPLGAKRR